MIDNRDASNQVSNSQNSLNGVAVNAAKKQASKQVKKAVAKKAGKKISELTIQELIKGAVVKAGVGVGAPVIALFLIITCLFSITTLLRTMFIGKVDVMDEVIAMDTTGIVKATLDEVTTAFNDLKNSEQVKDTVYNFARTEFGYNGGPESVLSTTDGYSLNTIGEIEETGVPYSISFTFNPTIREAAKYIAAYITAVDSTIMFYADKDEIKKGNVDKEFTVNDEGDVVIDEENYIKVDDDKLVKKRCDDDVCVIKNTNKEQCSGKGGTWVNDKCVYNTPYDLTDESNEAIDKTQPENIKEATREWHEKFQSSVSTFFEIEEDTSVWKDLGYVEHTYTNQGNVKIPLYFNATRYRKDELNETAEKLVGKGKCMFDDNGETNMYSNTCTKDEAYQAVNLTLNNYISTNMDLYKLEASTYYGMMLGGKKGFSGTIGTYSNFDYNSLTGFYPYSSAIAQKFWFHHALPLNDEGKIWGSTTDPLGGCTLFAQTWFYDVYGMNSSIGASGSGAQFATEVIAAHPDKFEYGREPAPGAILSIVNGGFGHVVCIDAVNYTNNAHTEGTVTFSDGNVNGGGIRIRVTVSLQEFNNKFSGQYIYAIPKK